MGNTVPILIHIKASVDKIIDIEVENPEGMKKLATLVEVKSFHRETPGKKR